jgi:thioesterase domain-containing protein
MSPYHQLNASDLGDVLARIPLAHAMRICDAHYTPDGLHLAAPAAPNLNHIGIAFGGAIECLGTLAGWGLLWLTLDDPALRLVIQHAETSFHIPLNGELHAVAHRPEQATWERFARQLKRHGRARLDITAHIGDTAHPEGASFHGRYAVARHVSC